jgi:hypothetical protein
MFLGGRCGLRADSGFPTKGAADSSWNERLLAVRASNGAADWPESQITKTNKGFYSGDALEMRWR